MHSFPRETSAKATPLPSRSDNLISFSTSVCHSVALDGSVHLVLPVSTCNPRGTGSPDGSFWADTAFPTSRQMARGGPAKPPLPGRWFSRNRLAFHPSPSGRWRLIGGIMMTNQVTRISTTRGKRTWKVEYQHRAVQSARTAAWPSA